MSECKKHPHGLLKSVDGGHYLGYEDEFVRVPCFCERTAHRQDGEGVLPPHNWYRCQIPLCERCYSIPNPRRS